MQRNFRFMNIEFLVFIVVLLLTLIFIIFYKLIKPEKDFPYNFSPFPNISPKDLPDADTTGGSCDVKLTACDATGNCSRCGEEDWECVNVEEDGQYIFNDIKVPKGQYCLPKKNPELSCNLYSGRWVWSTGNCPSGKTQCWKCLCLYPDLYGNPESGCVEKVACRNTNPIAGNTDQSNNILVGTQYAPQEIQGKQWNPADPDSLVIRTNPYTVDKDGNPWFACQCSNNDTGTNKPFMRLPNDPYSCHLDPCWKLNGYSFAGAYCGKDNCNCECSKNGGIVVPKGDLQGLCATEKGICGATGTWDTQKQQCNCGIGSIKQCKSKYINQDSSFPECQNPENPVGEECYNLCEPNPCNPAGLDPPQGVCEVIDGVAVCKCNSAGDGPLNTCTNKPVKYVWCGSDCSKKGLAPGESIKKQDGGCFPECKWRNCGNASKDKSQCCSGEFEFEIRDGDNWNVCK